MSVIMRDEDRWDEPQFVKDASKAVGYYAAWGFVLIMLLIVSFGAISPLFLPWMYRQMDKESNKDLKNNHMYQWIAKVVLGVIVVVWTLLSWLFWATVFTQIS